MLSHSTIIQFELLKSRFLVWSISETFANDLDKIFDGFLMTAHDVLFFLNQELSCHNVSIWAFPWDCLSILKEGGCSSKN